MGELPCQRQSYLPYFLLKRGKACSVSLCDDNDCVTESGENTASLLVLGDLLWSCLMVAKTVVLHDDTLSRPEQVGNIIGSVCQCGKRRALQRNLLVGIRFRKGVSSYVFWQREHEKSFSLAGRGQAFDGMHKGLSGSVGSLRRSGVCKKVLRLAQIGKGEAREGAFLRNCTKSVPPAPFADKFDTWQDAQLSL